MQVNTSLWIRDSSTVKPHVKRVAVFPKILTGYL